MMIPDLSRCTPRGTARVGSSPDFSSQFASFFVLPFFLKTSNPKKLMNNHFSLSV